LKLLAITFLALTWVAGFCAGQSDTGPGGILGHLWLSGQINVISQGHGSFRSPYSGPNSFAAAGEIETSRVLTLYTGFRFSGTTDFLFDLEETSGRNLSGSHGLAAFPNVDLAGVPDAHPYVARAMLHHEIRLSADEIDAERGPLQMAGRVAARRVEIYFGKMSPLDFFDVNAVGSDSHYQFMNWTLDNNAAYGYPADARGYTYAFVTEFHDRA
jgi:high affinity Mn2+ porin